MSVTTTHTPTVLIVPGLRDHVAEHWQTLLAARLAKVRTVPPMGRDDLDCAQRVEAIERAVAAIAGPVLIVAHSSACVMVAHWARVTRHAGAVRGVLLATPPDFDRPMPEGYRTLQALDASQRLAARVARAPAVSQPRRGQPQRPLGSAERVAELAEQWGSELLDLGEVGHLNPASGYGDWPMAEALIARLDRCGSTMRCSSHRAPAASPAMWWCGSWACPSRSCACR